jgi:hypothetical protein
MAKDPDARDPTAAAMVEDLRGALGTAAGPRAAARGGKGRPVLVAALGGATVVAAIATGIFAMRGDKPRTAAGPTTPPPRAGAVLDVSSTPGGARVRVAGIDRGATPLSLTLDDVGHAAATLVIEKPGYAATTRTIAGDGPEAVRVSLEPVTRFEGVWALPDGALRAFERRGERVAMFTLASGQGERTFERFFEFTGGEPGQIDFVASEDHVDPRGADEPSCHVPLRAEYVYDPLEDTLTRRQERASIDFAAGRCALAAKEWGEPVVLRRLEGEAAWAESSAGAGPPVSAPAVPNAADPVQNQKPTKPKKQVAKKVAPVPQMDAKDLPQEQQANPPPQQAQKKN